MAKILIISAVFPPEPVVSAQISYDLAENLCKQNEVTVLCPKPTRPFGYLSLIHIQMCIRDRDNPYGVSKKAGEELLFRYAEETGAKVYVYRFPNVFGKWCRPNYNMSLIHIQMCIRDSNYLCEPNRLFQSIFFGKPVIVGCNPCLLYTSRCV